MDFTDPLASIAPSVHTRLLVHLWHQQAPQSGRALARSVEPHATLPTVQKTLHDLLKAGVVVASNHPPAVLYELNRDHVATRAVAELAELRGRLWARVVAELEEWPTRPVGAYLFGSAARGEATTSSDVDLLVVYTDIDDATNAEARQTQLAERITAWSGNQSQIVGMTLSELAAADRAGQPLIADLQRDAVALNGPRMRTLVNQAHRASSP